MRGSAATDVRQGPSQDLDVEECRRLLASRHVGRLAYCGPFGPRIVPLGYALVDDLLLLRTSRSRDAARDVPKRFVAFEVDDLDEVHRTGWSVQVRGLADLLPLEALPTLDAAPSHPWTEGEQPLVIRLSLSSVAGRHVDAS